VECVVDTPHFWKLELIDDWGEDFSDGEGTFVFWSKFWVGNGMLEIPGFKPNFVSFVEGGKASTGMGGHDLLFKFVRS